MNYDELKGNVHAAAGNAFHLGLAGCVTLSALAAIELLVPEVEVSLYIYTMNTCIYIYV